MPSTSCDWRRGRKLKLPQCLPLRKYSPGECCGIRKHPVMGKPLKQLVSTSYVEKHNQTMRQHMRRFTRLTNGHSKKIDNHVHMVALYTTWYNLLA